MQVIYFTVCMLSLIVYLVLGVPAQEQQFKIDSRVIATHMTAWHKGAVRHCLAETCTVLVDPTSYLLPAIKDGPAFSKNRFTSRFDTTTKVLMTSVDSNVPDVTGVSYTVLMSALNEGVGGESSMIGVFDKAASKINLTALTGIYDRKVIDVPAGIAAAMTDGTPVIISNM
jgi:hypothetical protein